MNFNHAMQTLTELFGKESTEMNLGELSEVKAIAWLMLFQ